MNQSAISHYLSNDQDLTTTQKRLLTLFFIVGGIALISGLAQISIPLPFTPVPVTGQTFAVSLIGLLWGRRLAPAVLAGYLALGFIGAPVFAMGKSGLLFGPTFGYLIGMFVAASVVGYLSDRGWAKKIHHTILVNMMGSLCVFGCGLLVLSQFLPSQDLLTAGLIPFLPGDLIKNVLSATIAVQWNKRI